MNERSDTDRLQKNLGSQLLCSGADFVGFADVSGLKCSGNGKYLSAIALGIAYDAGIVRTLDSDIDGFETHLADTKKMMERLLEVAGRSLRRSGFTVWIPPVSTNLPGLLGDFSHKMAATIAGLGWIGKSSLFVSPQFGSGLRLATLLTDAPFAPGEPVTKSRCGDCIECVNACPYGAIKGEAWYPGIGRDTLLDAFLCSSKREEFIPRLGYKHPCGLCIQACPVRAIPDT